MKHHTEKNETSKYNRKINVRKILLILLKGLGVTVEKRTGTRAYMYVEYKDLAVATDTYITAYQLKVVLLNGNNTTEVSSRGC